MPADGPKVQAAQTLEIKENRKYAVVLTPLLAFFCAFTSDPGCNRMQIWEEEALKASLSIAACEKGMRGMDHGTRTHGSTCSVWWWELG